MHKKHPLVTGGDIQIFAAILNGVILRAPIPFEKKQARSFVEAAFDVFDEYKEQHAEREPKLKRPPGYERDPLI